MDPSRFDHLTTALARSATRRTALIGALAALGLSRSSLAAKQQKRPVRAQEAAVCYPSSKCTPGKGRNNSRCDFFGSALFRGLDARGANLSQSNFTAANLEGADLRSANLSGSCFIVANLRGARLSAANRHNAVFCGTIMPDGSVDNSGCDRQTACCQCPDGNCARNANDQPDCAGVLKRAKCQLVDDPQIGVTKWVCPAKVSMSGADLSGCFLPHAVLNEVHLENAFMNRAVLNDAQLKAAFLNGATMDSTTVINARFDSANLNRASMADTDMRNAVFQNAVLVLRDWSRTTCPDGTTTMHITTRNCCGHLKGSVPRQCGNA